jgi:hypothetical protein
MKKGVLILTSIITCCLFIFSFYLGYQYFVNNSISIEKKKIEKIQDEIIKLKVEVEEKKQEKEDVKTKNGEKAKTLDLWQKELQKVQK